MEAIEQFLMELVAKMPVIGYVLMGLGGLLALAQIVVLITPSKEDDAFVEKVKAIPVLGQILLFLESFAPFQKKADGKLTLSAAKKD